MTPTQIINAAAIRGGDRYTATKSYCLTETGTLVPEGDPASRYVLVAAGAELPLAVAQAVGLTGTPGEQVNARRAIEAGDGSFRPVRA